jgi:hypothetical protein
MPAPGYGAKWKAAMQCGKTERKQSRKHENENTKKGGPLIRFFVFRPFVILFVILIGYRALKR